MAEWYPKGKTCIVGIGETEYTRWGRIKRSEFQLACEAILKAIDDAGLTVKDIDGISSFSNDRNDASFLAATLGMGPQRFANMIQGGGGGGSGAVMNACLAVATGSANYVVVFRSLAQGQFGRFGQSRTVGRAGGGAASTAPYGQMAPGHFHGAVARRHMYEYGTQSKHFSMISVACYKHAQRNPRAVMYGRPLTLEQAESARMICDPLRLYHCCLETDGSAAVVVTSAERAKDLKQRPVYIMAAAQGSGYRFAAGSAGLSGINRPGPDFASANFRTVAADLFARAGITPKDIDVAQMYEHFAPFVLISLEDHGFCKRGEGGPFVEGGRLEWPDGALPTNTSGGNIAEAYTHGFELVTEAVRQMRGTSTCQVEHAEIGLVASGPATTPVSDMIVRR